MQIKFLRVVGLSLALGFVASIGTGRADDDDHRNPTKPCQSAPAERGGHGTPIPTDPCPPPQPVVPK
jgi:hypothetical protein